MPLVVNGWPDYQEFLRSYPGQKVNENAGKRAKVDCAWCKYSLKLGYTREAVEAKLLEVSEKARTEWNSGNRTYVSRTVDLALGLDRFF